MHSISSIIVCYPVVTHGLYRDKRFHSLMVALRMEHMHFFMMLLTSTTQHLVSSTLNELCQTEAPFNNVQYQDLTLLLIVINTLQLCTLFLQRTYGSTGVLKWSYFMHTSGFEPGVPLLSTFDCPFYTMTRIRTVSTSMPRYLQCITVKMESLLYGNGCLSTY